MQLMQLLQLSAIQCHFRQVNQDDEIQKVALSSFQTVESLMRIVILLEERPCVSSLAQVVS